jgi:hypothetical protein
VGTIYQQVLTGKDPVAQYTSSTGLRPFLEALHEPERTQFYETYAKLIAQAYPTRADGITLFPSAACSSWPAAHEAMACARRAALSGGSAGRNAADGGRPPIRWRSRPASRRCSAAARRSMPRSRCR